MEKVQLILQILHPYMFIPTSTVIREMRVVCLQCQNKIQFCVQYLVCIVFITLLYVRPTLILQGVPAISTQFRSQFLTFLIVLSKETRFAIKTQMV